MEKELYFTDSKQLRNYKIKKTIRLVLIYAFLTLVGIFIIVPFYWMLATSLKAGNDVDTLRELYPDPVRLKNYVDVITKTNSKGVMLLPVYFGNTILVALVTTFFVTLTTILAAFAFARLNFKGRDGLFFALLMTMMIPGEMLITTNYMTISLFGLTNSYVALILPFVVSTFYIFFLRQTFKQIPNELYLAAKVDGTGDFGYLFRIMIPIAKPTIITIIILSLMGTWNAYVWPRMAAPKDSMQLVANGIMSLFTGEFGDSPQLKLAASVCVSVPLLIFFLIFKKYIMRGVARSGIKG